MSPEDIQRKSRFSLAALENGGGLLVIVRKGDSKVAARVCRSPAPMSGGSPTAPSCALRFLGNCTLSYPRNRAPCHSVFRRFIATGLLLCMVLMVPASASSFRVCFLETEILLPGWTRQGDAEKSKCCQDCDGEEGSSCCLDLKKLPDAREPGSPIFRSLVGFCVLTPEVGFPPCTLFAVEMPFAPSTPIRGPDSPGERRALLEIWNI